jgi:hypothetical protein
MLGSAICGIIRSICPICGTEWHIVGRGDIVYIVQYCFCEETIREHQKGIGRSDLKATYAFSGGRSGCVGANLKIVPRV